MGKEFSGGIEIATGFKISNPNPVADYMIVQFVSDLDNLPNQFIGMETFVLETQEKWIKKIDGWVTDGGNQDLQSVLNQGAIADLDGNFSISSISKFGAVAISEDGVKISGQEKGVAINGDDGNINLNGKIIVSDNIDFGDINDFTQAERGLVANRDGSEFGMLFTNNGTAEIKTSNADNGTFSTAAVWPDVVQLTQAGPGYSHFLTVGANGVEITAGKTKINEKNVITSINGNLAEEDGSIQLDLGGDPSLEEARLNGDTFLGDVNFGEDNGNYAGLIFGSSYNQTKLSISNDDNYVFSINSNNGNDSKSILDFQGEGITARTDIFSFRNTTDYELLRVQGDNVNVLGGFNVSSVGDDSFFSVLSQDLDETKSVLQFQSSLENYSKQGLFIVSPSGQFFELGVYSSTDNKGIALIGQGGELKITANHEDSRGLIGTRYFNKQNAENAFAQIGDITESYLETSDTIHNIVVSKPRNTIIFTGTADAGWNLPDPAESTIGTRIEIYNATGTDIGFNLTINGNMKHANTEASITSRTISDDSGMMMLINSGTAWRILQII